MPSNEEINVSEKVLLKALVLRKDQEEVKVKNIINLRKERRRVFSRGYKGGQTLKCGMFKKKVYIILLIV